MPPEVKLGLIGLGYIGKIHVLGALNGPVCLDSLPVKVDYCSLLTTRPEKTEGLARYLGFRNVYTDLEEFLNSGIDAVDICTPNSLHLEQSRAAILHNLPVYCEKPLGNDLAEAKAMAEMVKEHKLPNQVAFTGRFSPAILRAKAYIENGIIGNILTARAHLFHSSYLDEKRPTSWRLQRRYSGGGAMADLGIHMIDRLRLLLGDVNAVTGTARTYIKERPVAENPRETIPVDVDDWAIANLEFECGAQAVVESSRIASGADGTSLEVFGSKGSIRIPVGENDWPLVHIFEEGTTYRGMKVDLDPVKKEIMSLIPGSKMSVGAMVNGHMASVLRFGLSVARNEVSYPTCPGFQEGAKAQEVLEAIYESSQQGKKIILRP